MFRFLLCSFVLWMGVWHPLHAQTNDRPLVSTLAIAPDDTHATIIEKASRIVPKKIQLVALQDEYIAFIHFGPNTFTAKEWGTGKEDPALFALKELHTDQWCRAMKASGMKKVILTVKHHDGFCLWQTRYTKHGVMSSPFQNGQGDILKELSQSCQKYGLKLGIYLSPADLYQMESPTGLYGNGSSLTTRVIPTPVPGRPFANKNTFTFDSIDDYNAYFLNQLFELLTEYGNISEVWFDGAHPKHKGNQQYRYPAWKKLIRTLAPEAVIFGREDVRWCGNEGGATRKTEWNVIPYPENPNTTSHFPDMQDPNLGSRENLYAAKYLHYQPAETNTSIREGWFYRNEKQRVRSADDVFDMYERAVGGNSTFLLNIPPNREGKFADQDVAVLEEVGKRIANTYTHNLLQKAKGNKALFDDDIYTFVPLKEKTSVEIYLDAPVTVNRFLLQEAVSAYGERVEKHVLDAKINGKWVAIDSATNIGYKRILRFPTVSTNAFRVRFLSTRNQVVLANLGAFYYASHPPQVAAFRDKTGLLHIDAKTSNFSWNLYGENPSRNLNPDLTIYYTTDGSEPSAQSQTYTAPFPFEGGMLKAVAYIRHQKGAIFAKEFGLQKKAWVVLECSDNTSKHNAQFSIDNDPNTYWASATPSPTTKPPKHYLTIDLGNIHTLHGFTYTPAQNNSEGMIEKGQLFFSLDRKQWVGPVVFDFGNLINDPSARTLEFEKMPARYVRLEALNIAKDAPNAHIAELDFLFIRK